MRVFIGLSAPIFPTVQYQSLEKELKQSFKSNKINGFFKREADFHITLQFLGEITPEQVKSIDFLQELTREFYKQDFLVTGMGSFPNWDKARGVWLGLRQNAELNMLHENLTKKLTAKGFKLSPRPFIPHVTIASFLTPVDVLASLGAVRQKFTQFEFQPAALNIYQSEKNMGGSRYKVLKSIKLIDPPYNENSF